MDTKLKLSHKLIALLLLISIGLLVNIFFKKEAEKQREIVRRIPEAYRAGKNVTDAIIDSMLNLQGDIYVYTNDSSVQAEWAPNLNENYTLGGVKSLAGELVARKEFIKNKDSLGFRLILKAADNRSYAINKSLLLGGNDSGSKVWFFTYGRGQKVTDSVAPIKARLPIRKNDFVHSWGVSIAKTDTLFNKQILNLPPLKAAALLLKPANSYFYVAGYYRDNGIINMTSADFGEVVKRVNVVLKKEGIHLKNFSFYYFSGGIRNIVSPLPESGIALTIGKK
jgi:hypothetical protein